MNLQLLPANRYVTQLTHDVNKAQNHIYLLSMAMNDDDSTRQLFEAVIAAAHRGVKVHVAADIFTFGEEFGRIFPIWYYSEKLREVRAMVDNLRDAGAKFDWLGKRNFTLINGKTHTKWSIVDDVSYAFGGVNLYDKGIANADYMFRCESKDLSSELAVSFHETVDADKKHYSLRNRRFELPFGTMLLDGGLPGSSLIYKRASELTKKAEHVLYVSQYCPTGRLSRLLKNTDSSLYFNPWQKARSLSRFVIRMGMLISGHKTLYKRSRYLHAKCMVFTMKDGSKVALTGSHNFSNGGVILGTREIALETTDSDVIAQLENFITKNII